MFKRTLILTGVALFSLAALWGLMWLMSAPIPVARAAADCVIIGSDITADTTWSEACYQVMTTTVTVHPDVVLTISPPVTGTRVEFQARAQLQVLGNLQALGTASRPITFTSISTAPARCDWLGIILEDDGGGDRIQHSIVEYACTGIKINDEDNVSILSNTLRYNGDGASRAGAIGGDADGAEIGNNHIYSCSNGIALGEAFSNRIISNTLHDIDGHGVVLIKEGAAPGGSLNTISDNEIYACDRDGLRLEEGYRNRVFSNTIYSVFNSTLPGGAIYLSEQAEAIIQYNHVYSNGDGSAYRAAVYITGTADLARNYPNIAHNVIYDEHAEAIEYADVNNSLSPSMTFNALCSIPSWELQNSADVTIDAPYNWWSTNTPTDNVSGLVNFTPWITLALNGTADGVLTVTLRDREGHTVPPPADRQTVPAAPNARRVELSSNWGTVIPTAVVVNGQGIATASLLPDGAPAPSPVVLTATAFCDYPVTATIELPNLVITKTSPLTQVVAGNLLTYTILYSNLGPVNAEGVVIRDVLPPGTTYVTDTSDLFCPACVPGATGPLAWTVGSLAPAPPAYSFTLVLQTGISPTLCNATLTNTVYITATTLESDQADNWDIDDTVTVICLGVDFTVVKDDDVGPTTPTGLSLTRAKQAALAHLLRMDGGSAPLAVAQHRDFVYEGDIVTYTIAVVNTSPYTATNVVLTETLPEHSDYLGVGWTHVSGRTYITTVGTLPPDDGRIFYFVVQIHHALPDGVNNLINHVCGWSDEYDVNPGDNCNYEDTPVRRWPLRVEKSAPACISPGERFDYYITYQNTTTSTTFRNVGLTDTLDAHVNYTGGPDWNCAGRICSRTIPTIAPGTSGSLRLPVRLSATFPYTLRTTITNVVEISGGNRFILTRTVDTGPDLAVVKNDNVGPLPLAQQMRWIALYGRLYGLRQVTPLQPAQHREFVRPGELITYTILYANTGIGAATGVVLTETLPEHTRYVSGGWVHASGRQYVLHVGDLPPGHGGEAHFIVQVDDPFPLSLDRVINGVEVGGRETECDPDNNRSADDTPVRTDVNLYVANLDSGTLDVFNTTAFDYLTSIPAGPHPFGMATADDLLFVANFEDHTYLSTLTIISITSQTVVSTPTVGRHPIHVAAYGDYVYVANHSGGEGITVVDWEGHVVARVSPDQHLVYDFGFFGVTADTRRGLIYATKRDFGGLGIWALTPPDRGLTLTHVVDTPGNKPSSIVYHPSTDRVYVTMGLIDELWVYDPEDWALLERISTGHQDPVDPGYGGHGLAALGQCVFVSNYRGQSVTAVVNGGCVESLAPGPAPSPTGPYQVYLPIVGRNFVAQQVIVTVPLGGHPMGMTAAGNLLFVALPLEGKVVIINTETLTVIDELSASGDHPHTVILAGGNYIGPAP